MLAPATLSLRPCAHFKPTQPCIAPATSFTSSSATLQFSRGSNHSPSLSVRAVAIDSDQLGSSEPVQQEKKRYYFLVANAKFMLDEEEHFQEVMFERRRLFEERKREQDFWLVIEPKFLDKFPNVTKRLNRPAVALVSTDRRWITFMKLRLDRVLAGDFEADTTVEALDSNSVDLKFEKPSTWTAPYQKYEFGWWETFLPPNSSGNEA